MSRPSDDGDHSPAAQDHYHDRANVHHTTDDATTQIHEGCHVVAARLPGGLHMALEVPISDDIGDRIASSSRPYEAVDLRIVDALLPQRPVVIDIGANIGNHSIYWALTHWAQVTAFEPYAPAKQLLDANIARNSVGELVVARREALGASAGRAAPEPRAGNLGATRMHTDPNGRIDVAALDTLSPAGCDLLKVDVEGDELAVLEGASDLLNRLRPLVWVEALTAADHRAVRELMRSHGYRTWLMLSPTNTLYLPSRRRMLQLIVKPRALVAYSRRRVGPALRRLQVQDRETNRNSTLRKLSSGCCRLV